MKIVYGRPSGVRTALPSPPAGGPPGGSGRAGARPEPEPDQFYPVKLDNGRTIEVKFGPDLCQRIREWDMAVYLTRGRLLSPDGQLYRLDSQISRLNSRPTVMPCFLATRACAAQP